MKKRILLKSLIAAAGVAAALTAPALAEDLVILHTNDTHSLIEPDARGAGGVLQRKAIVDSIRKAEKNVILVDAGDMVQGSLYFKYFRGDVEFPLANMMGYDVQILGNHEFDNGLKELAEHYRTLKASRLSANYDFSDTPLKGLFDPYVIKKVGGKKIGFIGINVDPESLISRHNYEGLHFKDVISTANRTAEMLKREKKCDLVVVVSHIGAVKENEKTTDYELAEASRDIDIIIGGHSHTMIRPGTKASDRPDARPGENKFCPSVVANADGRPVLVVQTGKYGRMLGYIKIDLDRLKEATPENFDYRLISVSDRFPESELDAKMKAFLAPYKAKVDSVNARVIATSFYDLRSDARTGGYPNFVSDFAKWYGDLKSDSLRAAGQDVPRPDFAVMNVGGIRQNMPAGDVTEGEILSTFPFANYMLIQTLKGSDFVEAMKMAAGKGGEGISDEVRVLTDADGKVVSVLVDGAEIDPDREYVVATLDYVGEGNDDFVTFPNGRLLWKDDEQMVAAMMRYITSLSESGMPLAPDPTPRFLRAYGK